MGKSKVYYDPESCRFVERSDDYTRKLKRIGSFIVAATIIAIGGHWILNQTIGTPYAHVLKHRNDVLAQELHRLEYRISGVSDQLSKLSQRDNQLYRPLLNIDLISPELRKVGIGGTDPSGWLTVDAQADAPFLAKQKNRIEHLERRLTLEEESIQTLRQNAQNYYSSLQQLPAILPASGAIGSQFGMRFHPVRHVRTMHAGIDLRTGSGAPVYATAAGTVTMAGRYGGYGKHVQIKHEGSGYTTLYAHLSRIPAEIRSGTPVARGDTIGFTGSTGLSTGPHLHYEVRNKQGEQVNPLLFLERGMTPSTYWQINSSPALASNMENEARAIE